MIEHVRQLKSVYVAGGEVRRRLVDVEGVTIVLLEKQHPLMRPAFSRVEWNSFLSEECPAIMRPEVKRCNRSLRFSYNCHMVAIGAQLGLAPTEWLEGTSGSHVLNSNPSQTLLDKFFVPICRASSAEGLVDVHQDAVIVLRNRSTGDLVHSGRIYLDRGTTWVLSKIGEHPTAGNRLEQILEVYRGEFNEIEVLSRR